MKALIIDQVSENISKYLTANGFDVTYIFLPTKAELTEIIGEYDLLVMRVDPKIDKEVLDAAKNLKAITVAATGLDHIDLAYAKQRGIEITNAFGGNSNAVAEMTFCKILEMARHSIAANREIKEFHKWNKYKWTGFELKGTTIGIVGYGKIGSRVGEIARGFGMNVLACDPALTKEQLEAMGAKKVSMQELLKSARIITLHVPLNEQTRGMISEKEFEQMRPDALLLNMARGGIVNEGAAYHALKSQKIAAISVDVLEVEKTANFIKGEAQVNSPLFELENFTVSPHIAGGGTVNSLDALGDTVIENISRIFSL